MFSGITVRALGIVWVSSHSFGVGIVHRLFCWIPYSIRNVLTILRTVLNRLDRFGNQISRFIRFYFQKQQLGYFALFGPVLTHLELESYTVPFFWVPYSVINVLKILIFFFNWLDQLGNLISQFVGFFFLGIT